jgi:uncharacterized protein YegJ (DUF2314 family)
MSRRKSGEKQGVCRLLVRHKKENTMKVTHGFLATIIVSLIIAVGCNKKPETLTTKYDEKKMEKAISDARAALDTFLTRFKNPQPGDSAFNVKVRIEDENGVEHFWVGDLKLDAEPYKGKIGNDAGIVKKVKLGQIYSFTRKDISDWMYMNNGKMQGNYTLRVELESMPKKEAEALKKQVGW